jgi:hypothetical protein
MENTLKEDKRIWRMRQKYFAVHGEYAKTRKNSDPKSPHQK